MSFEDFKIKAEEHKPKAVWVVSARNDLRERDRAGPDEPVLLPDAASGRRAPPSRAALGIR